MSLETKERLSNKSPVVMLRCHKPNKQIYFDLPTQLNNLCSGINYALIVMVTTVKKLDLKYLFYMLLHLVLWVSNDQEGVRVCWDFDVCLKK